MRKIIVVAGLGDHGKELKLATAWWKKEGLEPIIFLPRWYNQKGVAPKLKRLLELVDQESVKKPVAVMGISAGASLALNAFLERKGKIDKVISLCGRLKMGWSDNIINKKLQEITLKNNGFKESVKLLQKNIHKLTEADKKKILTVSSEYGDELIPIETSQIEGAENILVPVLGHVLSISAAMTFNFEPIKKFLKG